jgi:hypothetical protein
VYRSIRKFACQDGLEYFKVSPKFCQNLTTKSGVQTILQRFIAVNK